jgi:hypothetical protein
MKTFQQYMNEQTPQYSRTGMPLSVMAFEIYTRKGHGWQYRGIAYGNDSLEAATAAHKHYRSNIVAVRPEDSRDKKLIYRW